MLIGRYPPGMDPLTVAKIFTTLLLERRERGFSRKNTDARLGPYAKGDNGWQLDDTNNYWIRINPSEHRYTLSCRYDSDSATVQTIVRQFEDTHLKKK